MIEVQEIMERVSEASLLWNREPEQFGKLMGEAQSLLIRLNANRDSCLQSLERENSAYQEQIAALKLEVARLEKCLEDGDYEPCEECQGTWHRDDLTDVNDYKFCPRCVEQALAEDAAEAIAEADIDREYSRQRTNNMRAAG